MMLMLLVINLQVGLDSQLILEIILGIRVHWFKHSKLIIEITKVNQEHLLELQMTRRTSITVLKPIINKSNNRKYNHMNQTTLQTQSRWKQLRCLQRENLWLKVWNNKKSQYQMTMRERTQSENTIRDSQSWGTRLRIKLMIQTILCWIWEIASRKIMDLLISWVEIAHVSIKRKRILKEWLKIEKILS